MRIKMVSGKLVPAVLFLLTAILTGLSPVSVDASTVGLQDVGNPGVGHGRAGNRSIFANVELPPVHGGSNMIMLPAIGNPGHGFGRPDHVPPVNPPIDTPAFYNGLVNAPAIMPPSVPYDTLPGSGFGQVVVPIPAAAWSFASGLVGLISMARRRKQ